MSFFTVGELYRDTYHIQHVEPFFNGEWAVAESEGNLFYLQHAQLQKPAPPRSVQQYLALSHPMILPYQQVYTEERSLVFIRPYEPIEERLDQRIHRGGLDEDQILDWVKSLLELEPLLKGQPLPMYTLLHPGNIVILPNGSLQVWYCGVSGRTLPDPTLDWGSLLYMMFTGRLLDEPITKLSGDEGFSKHLNRLIQRSFKHDANHVRDQIETYLRKRDSTSLFDSLFGRSKPKERSKPAPSDTKGASLRQLSLEEEAERREQERLAREEAERREQERLAREEAERREQERLARKEAERREQERLAREEAERREQERLACKEAKRREQQNRVLERLARERKQHDQIAAQLQEYVDHVFNRTS
ncbi:hypothetical protein GCM10011571_31480 [Marinithermofilum abyssi]|uniref:Uncharacterized protein n=1 Tax=Marinithermofilum abyssi TaxID=1571185 RepID=A0A8J2YDS0_9BACL|nr:hypothetical protein [Marinithermofilum abyssi]GGE26978.1 hypothetical protein GCM10011571_31480 [Marinithermofilum abyssi]